MSARTLRRVGIAGTGAYVPTKVLTNDDLSKMVATSDEWIQQRTGIRERRIVPTGMTTSDMCAEAARRALAAAKLEAKDVDLLLVGTVSGDCIFPATACAVAHKIGATNAGGYDLSGACTGFLMGLSTGAQFVATGAYDIVLVIGAESLSRLIDYKDRNSCILFGDGAGAAVLRPWDKAGRGEILHSTLGMDGSQFEMIWVPAGLARTPVNYQLLEEKQHLMKIRGREVYQFAVRKMVELVERELARYPGEEVGLVIPHQVNLRIIESAIERLAIPMEKVVVNIDRYGNTSAASIPVALDEAVRAGRMPKGKLVVFVAFGAGLAWGSTLVRW